MTHRDGGTEADVTAKIGKARVAAFPLTEESFEIQRPFLEKDQGFRYKCQGSSFQNRKNMEDYTVTTAKRI